MKNRLHRSCARMTAAMVLLFEAGASAEEGGIRRFKNDGVYPAECLASSDGPRSVTVAYMVTKDRSAENIRIVDSDNACFDEAAVNITRDDFFLSISPSAKIPTDREFYHTLTFFQDSEPKPGFDITGIKQVPPNYPGRCFDNAAGIEIVIVAFDVTAGGDTTNPRAIDSTNSCLDEAAMAAVRKWRYPTTEGKERDEIVLSGVETITTFEQAGEEVGVDVRDSFSDRVLAAGKKLDGSEPTARLALADLAIIEAGFGASFSRYETAMFYRQKAAAFADLKEMAKLLDALRYAGGYGSPRFGDEQKIESVIKQLRAAFPRIANTRVTATEPAPANPDARGLR